MNNAYIQSKKINEWIVAIPNDELYSLVVYDNFTICSIVGRYAHSSGCLMFSWQQLLDKEFDEHITKIFGNEVLKSVKDFIKSKINE